MLQIPLEMAPDSRDQINIGEFSVANTEPGEYSENPQISLSPENSIRRIEIPDFPFRGFLCPVFPYGVDITRFHVILQRFGGVAPSIFEQGCQIVGGMAGNCVLEVENADSPDPLAPGQPHDVLGMIVPEDKNFPGIFRSAVCIECRNDQVNEFPFA